jgi:AraC-like DNA-binding protein
MALLSCQLTARVNKASTLTIYKTSMSSKTYLYKIRLALAKQLLQSSDLKIDEVAKRYGFDDPEQFHRYGPYTTTANLQRFALE